MLLVRTRIGPSSIAGIGLFAVEDIAATTPVWKLQEGFDVRLTQKDFLKLSMPAQEQVLNYCYFNERTQTYVVCGDDARFFNHSDAPNVSSSSEEDAVDCALRDIAAGEELTQDYHNFDGDAAAKLS